MSNSSTPSAAMATLLTHLRRWSRTYGFRITLLYVALVGVSVLILFTVLYWITAEFMEEQLRGAIDTEMASLVDDFGSSGINSTIDAIARRTISREHQSSYYLLQDPAGRKIAGDLPPMPATAGWYELPIPAQDGDDTDPTDTLMGQGRVLSNGWFLVVGQD